MRQRNIRIRRGVTCARLERRMDEGGVHLHWIVLGLGGCTWAHWELMWTLTSATRLGESALLVGVQRVHARGTTP